MQIRLAAKGQPGLHTHISLHNRSSVSLTLHSRPTNELMKSLRYLNSSIGAAALHQPGGGTPAFCLYNL